MAVPALIPIAAKVGTKIAAKAAAKKAAAAAAKKAAAKLAAKKAAAKTARSATKVWTGEVVSKGHKLGPKGRGSFAMKNPGWSERVSPKPTTAWTQGMSGKGGALTTTPTKGGSLVPAGQGAPWPSTGPYVPEITGAAGGKGNSLASLWKKFQTSKIGSSKLGKAAKWGAGAAAASAGVGGLMDLFGGEEEEVGVGEDPYSGMDSAMGEFAQQMPQGMGQDPYAYMSPEEQQWLEMITGNINQMGAGTDDPRVHQRLQMEWLDALMGTKPDRQDPTRMYDEAMEMVEMGQLIGDNDMVNEAQDILRSMYGMESMPRPGSPEYADEILNQGLVELFKNKFPGQSVDPETGIPGEMESSHLRNMDLQGQGQANPNLIRQYLDQDLGFWEGLFMGGDKKEDTKLERAGFRVPERLDF